MTRMGRGNSQINRLAKGSSEQLFKELLSRSRDLLYKYNLSTDKYEYISDSVTVLTGSAADDFLKGPAIKIFDILHPEDKPRLMKLYEGLKTNLLRNLNITVEYRIRHQNGRYVWISDNIHAIYGKDGRTASIVGNARDVTAYKELQDRFEENAELNRLLSKNLPFAYFRTRISDGKVLECNDTLWRLLGFKNKTECLKTCYLSEYYAPEFRVQILKKLEREGQLSKMQIQARLMNRIIWVETSAQMFPQQGYIEGIFREISVIKLLTPTELTILRLVLEGKCNKEIAQELHRSIRTIEDHRSHMMKKLNVHNLAELVRKTSSVMD